MTLADVVIVLCRPSEPGNVGAVCRAMKNMGLSRLRLVRPEPMDPGVIQARAVHAGDVWEGAETFDTLSAAISGCAFVSGITRRRGRRRKITLEPRELAARLRERQGGAALVFGSERTGLEAGEMALCGAASHIPAAEAFPSLNLSHAVQIYAYELFRALGPAEGQEPGVRAPEGSWTPLAHAALEGLAGSITDALASLGFYRQPGREEQERFFRDILSRAGVTAHEGAYLEGIFAKAARLALRGAAGAGESPHSG